MCKALSETNKQTNKKPTKLKKKKNSKMTGGMAQIVETLSSIPIITKKILL
jgi:hypothetical protein